MMGYNGIVKRLTNHVGGFMNRQEIEKIIRFTLESVSEMVEDDDEFVYDMHTERERGFNAYREQLVIQALEKLGIGEDDEEDAEDNGEVL